MFITKEQITLSARQFVDGFVMPQKIAFGCKAPRMITTIDCAYEWPLMLVHVLAK
jgi:hypothetical protein